MICYIMDTSQGGSWEGSWISWEGSWITCHPWVVPWIILCDETHSMGHPTGYISLISDEVPLEALEVIHLKFHGSSQISLVVALMSRGATYVTTHRT